MVLLWAMADAAPRFEARHFFPVSCVGWKPRLTERMSSGVPGSEDWPDVCHSTAEDLIVGDDGGSIYYYHVEWPRMDEFTGEMIAGAVKLLGRYQVHHQQVCGLAWSPDGKLVATGGNDNNVCLFDADGLAKEHTNDRPHYHHIYTRTESVVGGDGFRRQLIIPGAKPIAPAGAARVRHRWRHGAAVKAIAFCPWRPELIASGGGSNDRMIHFHHTETGSRIRSIYVGAQVTSLVWSSCRREIAVTFGFPQPTHPYRIAVYSWPQCQQLVAIPWGYDLRALYAIAFPSPRKEIRNVSGADEGGVWASAAATDGCIVVASSDESIKFQEVWSDGRRGIDGNRGDLGGSEILESFVGIDKPSAQTIR